MFVETGLRAIIAWEGTMTGLLSSLAHDPIVQGIAHIIMWHEYLALLPFIVGVAIMALVQTWFINQDWASRILVIMSIPVCLILLYAGMTGVAAAMDIGDVSSREFAVPYVVALVQAASGLLLAYLVFTGPAVRRLCDEENYSASLDQTIAGYRIAKG